jgi:Ran GTPase-activating protein (RanGAP) involved in mRNA processing and transport
MYPKLTLTSRCTHFDALGFNLPAFSALVHLDVSQNELSEHGAQDLAARLGAAPALRSLELTNCVRANDVRSLAAGLARCARLARLRLAYNNIACPAATEHARALRACSALTLLDLTGNAIYNVGAQALARALEHYPALVRLTLPYNHIGFLGARVPCRPLAAWPVPN